MVEYSTGYIKRTRETLESLDKSFTPKTRAVAQGLKAHFDKSATKAVLEEDREAA